jgi:tetratricopeptide (TPR) repeat protein
VAAALLAFPLGYLALRHGPTRNNLAQNVSPTGPDPSIEQEEEFVREHPTKDNRINLSLAYVRDREPVRAISLRNALLAEDGNDVRAWNNLCVADTMQMRDNLAIAACKRALLLAPDFELARNNLKWAEDEDQKAVAAISAQEQIAPASRNAASYRAEGLDDLHIGSYDQAIEAWQQALRLDPANVLGYPKHWHGIHAPAAARTCCFLVPKGDRHGPESADRKQQSGLGSWRIDQGNQIAWPVRREEGRPRP